MLRMLLGLAALSTVFASAVSAQSPITTISTELSEHDQAVQDKLDALQAQINSTKSGVFEFVGFSSGMVQGDVAFVGMHAACQADFGPDSRMCTSKEYALSPNAGVPGFNAWVHPVPGLASSTDFTEGPDSCVGSFGGWSNADSAKSGMTVDPNGHISNIVSLTINATCDAPRSVTCCSRVN